MKEYSTNSIQRKLGALKKVSGIINRLGYDLIKEKHRQYLSKKHDWKYA